MSKMVQRQKTVCLTAVCDFDSTLKQVSWALLFYSLASSIVVHFPTLSLLCNQSSKQNIRNVHATIVVSVKEVMVVMVIRMPQYWISRMSLARSEHGEAKPQITSIWMRIRQDWSQVYGEEVPHGKFQWMCIYTSHGGRCRKSMMNLVDGLVQPIVGMELIMNQIKAKVCHQHANWQFDQQFALPVPAAFQ